MHDQNTRLGRKTALSSHLLKTNQKKRDLTKEWRLHIEKCILSTKTLHTEEEGCDSDLLKTIRNFTDQGARLVAAEPIGYVRSTTLNVQYSVMGVNLFFNIPQTASPCIWQYHMIRVPTRYTVVPDATQSVQQIECDADWMGQMKMFLDQGWKLVDICMDTTALADAFGMKRASKNIDTIWLFEKEDSKMNDLEAQYEGVIIEYLHKVKSSMGGETPCRDWRPVIAGMGLSGWELATIVQTPLLIQSSFTTYILKMLFIFQRKLYPEHRKATEDYIKKFQMEQIKKDPLGYYRETSGAGSYGTLPANHGSSVQKGNRKSTFPSTPQPGNRVRFQDENPQVGAGRGGGYFNQILGRYVYPVDEPNDEEPQHSRRGAVGGAVPRGGAVGGAGRGAVGGVPAGRGGGGAGQQGGAGRGAANIPNGVPPGHLFSHYTSPSLGPIIHGKR